MFSSSHRHGFTLVELSIVLIIVSLLASGGLAISASMVDRAAYTDTQKQLKMIEEALQDFYIVNGRLPCVARIDSPMNDANFGVEIAANGCDSGTSTAGNWRPSAPVPANGPVRIGMVPVRTLGLQDIAARDKYGNRILYAVTEDLTRSSSFGGTSGALVVQDVNDNEILDDAAYVLVSNGKDRKGAYLYQTGALDFGCASGFGEADRLNCDTNDEFFRDAPYNAGEVANTYFDDLIRWAPKFHLSATSTSSSSSSLWAVDSTNPDSIISVGTDDDTATGNVGIGIANPQERLQVDWGNIRVGKTIISDLADAGPFGLKRGSLWALKLNDTSAAQSGSLVGSMENTSYFHLIGSIDMREGASITLGGRSYAGNPGTAIYRGASNTNSSTNAAHLFTKITSAGASTTLLVIRTNGSIQSVNNGTYCYINNGYDISCSSDRRLKEDIVPVESALDKLLQINGVYYKWKNGAKVDGKDTQKQHLGVIAQEVQSVFPEIVDESENGYLTVSMSGLISPIIESIRELKNRNDALQAKVDNLETRLAALEQHANVASASPADAETAPDMRMMVMLLGAMLVGGILVLLARRK